MRATQQPAEAVESPELSPLAFGRWPTPLLASVSLLRPLTDRRACSASAMFSGESCLEHPGTMLASTFVNFLRLVQHANHGPRRPPGLLK